MAVKKEKSVASKTSLNLAMRERDMSRSPIVIGPLVALIVALAVLLGWGVATQLGRVNKAQREVDGIRENIRVIEAQYADYDEVQKEYNRYTYKDFDRTMVDRLDVMSLIERDIFPVCQVRDLSVAGRQMSLVLEGLTLESTSNLMTRLNAEGMVRSVSVSTYDATSENGTVTLTNMVIVLEDATLAEEVS